jgi:hypothetical protein
MEILVRILPENKKSAWAVHRTPCGGKLPILVYLGLVV